MPHDNMQDLRPASAVVSSQLTAPTMSSPFTQLQLSDKKANAQISVFEILLAGEANSKWHEASRSRTFGCHVFKNKTILEKPRTTLSFDFLLLPVLGITCLLGPHGRRLEIGLET